MQTTRQEILEILQEDGQATVDDLAQRLELTPMTIRHHLNVLQAQNTVVASQVRRSQKVGRPRLVYTLTEAAGELFPQNYGNLARLLVSEVKKAIGQERTLVIFRRIAERLAQEAPPPSADQSFEERLTEVAAFLESQGFISRWEKTDEEYVLVNINCPYRQVVREHDEVCEMDMILLTRLLGVQPQRTSCLPREPACRYVIRPPA